MRPVQFLLERLESLDAEEFGRGLRNASSGEEDALRTYFGQRQFDRLQELALRQTLGGPARSRTQGNVIVIPSILGSELTDFTDGIPLPIWLRVRELVQGKLDRLRLGNDGRSSRFDIRPTGILKRTYGEMLLSLSTNWTVRSFWYDWRKDLDIAADELAARVEGWFGPNEPFHIVAHGMGGLVARAFIGKHAERWARAADLQAEDASRGGRLLMLGTPNYGTVAVLQVLMGLAPMVRKLASVDVQHGLAGVLEVIRSFPGLHQMLPSPFGFESEDVEAFYRAETYAGPSILQTHLDDARSFHQSLQAAVDPERMTVIAGIGRPTPARVRDGSRLHDPNAYLYTAHGDGWITCERAALKAGNDRRIPAWYVDEEHGDLAGNDLVLAAVEDILQTGTTTLLSDRRPKESRSGALTASRRLVKRIERRLDEEEQTLDRMISLQRPRGRGGSRGHAPDEVEDRKLEELLASGLLGSAVELRRRPHDEVPFPATRIQIRLVQASIETVHDLPPEELFPVIDVLAVGHYFGVTPKTAELALDQAISRAQPDGSLVEGNRLLLTDYAERGVLRGDLGQTFFLPDPREPGRRLIAIAGMGLPGRLGLPELTVLARELCWSLGRMGKRHLATVLIGCGRGNLTVEDAVNAWVRGIKYAVSGAATNNAHLLRSITFVERNGQKFAQVWRGLAAERHRLQRDGRLVIELFPAEEPPVHARPAAAAVASGEDAEDDRQPSEGRAPTRITATLDGEKYRFGAITRTASVPEREIPLDPRLVETANRELAAGRNLEDQVESGRFLQKLLIPSELRPEIESAAPLVLLLDRTTARIHWEMLAHSEMWNPNPIASDHPLQLSEPQYLFWAMGRSLTRQLRTTFAPPPEPPPPPRRLLRVLIVADPAEDASLAGAREEGVEIADVFESFNRVYAGHTQNRVEVVRLFGPRQASRTNVLKHLMLRSYDVLHFAGHCDYNAGDPQSSGWVFSGGTRLTARELNRIDRVPHFVFSNACESGVTADRPERRSPELAPSFAEAFFARGVSNFVCTAWPVDDQAARIFAKVLYTHLLGLDPLNGYGRFARNPPVEMHRAMREARLRLAASPAGLQTWGAYQHYGNPSFRLFDPRTF